MLEVDMNNFVQEVEQSDQPVVLDFWGPQCGPCLALMPDVEKLAESYKGKAKFCKVNVVGNRRLCIQLKVMSVPTILFYKGGEQDRLFGDGANLDAIKQKTDALIR